VPLRLEFVALSILLVLSWCAAAAAQEANSVGSASASQPAIRSTTRLVQIQVVVQSRSGEPLLGLKKEDFRVFDQGRPQSIAVFSARDRVEELPAHSFPKNVFTNRYDLKGQATGNVTVVLFDALNTSGRDQMQVRKRVLRFLQTLKPEDHIAIYALTKELLILHEFTRDSASLVSAVSHFTPEEMASFDASNPEKIDLVRLTGSKDWLAFQNALNNVNAAVADRATIDRVRITTAAIEAIAGHVAAIPGQKSLIWVSGGFPVQIGTVVIGRPDNLTLEAATDPRTMAGVTQYSPVGGEDATNKLNHSDRESGSLEPRINRAALALNRVNMVMYPIDANGVLVDAPSSVDQRSVTTSQDSFTLAKEQEARDSSRLLADQTGGLAFFGSNDVADALRRAMQDGQYAYTIGFYPDHGKWNGKFHELRINVRSDGARLRCRKGYFALPYQADSEKEVSVSLQQAALSPLEETGLGMIVEAKVIEPYSARSLQLRIGIDPKQLLLQDSHGEQKGAVDLLFAQRDSAGKTLSAEKQHFNIKLPQAQYEYLATAGMVLEHHMIVSPQAAEISVIVRDAGSGAVGSTYVPVSTVLPSQ
jgi:VWFA-related protein